MRLLIHIAGKHERIVEKLVKTIQRRLPEDAEVVTGDYAFASFKGNQYRIYVRMDNQQVDPRAKNYHVFIQSICVDEVVESLTPFLLQ